MNLFWTSQLSVRLRGSKKHCQTVLLRVRSESTCLLQTESVRRTVVALDFLAFKWHTSYFFKDRDKHTHKCMCKYRCMHVNTDVCRCMCVNADIFVDTYKQICISVGWVPPSDALPENYLISCWFRSYCNRDQDHLTCCSKCKHLEVFKPRNLRMKIPILASAPLSHTVIQWEAPQFYSYVQPHFLNTPSSH